MTEAGATTGDSIAQLMDRDPLSLSKLELDKLVDYYRGTRRAFVAGNKSIGKPEAKKTAKQKATEELANVIKTDDLLSKLF